MKLLKPVVAAAAALVATSALAHHNANAQYDNSKEFQIVGTLKEIRDVAPHAQWTITAVNPATHAQTTWRFEAAGNNALRRMGVQIKTDLRVGQSYTYFYTPARDGSNTGFLTAIIINGQKYTIFKL